MARRKKTEEGFHREQIITAAQKLFLDNGVDNTSMDEISRFSGYSKATLYVHFSSKEELVAELAKNSMKQLYERLCDAISSEPDVKMKYYALCTALMRYQEECPDYFEVTLGEIEAGAEEERIWMIQKETFAIGEQINEKIKEILMEGAQEGIFRKNISSVKHILLIWSCLSGMIRMSAKKRGYLETLGISREEFCTGGFELLYHAIKERSLDV